MFRVSKFAPKSPLKLQTSLILAALGSSLIGSGIALTTIPANTANAEGLKYSGHTTRTIKISPTKRRVISVARGRGEHARIGAHRKVGGRYVYHHRRNPYYTRHHQITAGQWYKKYNGPLVIHVPDALEKKRLRVIAGSEPRDKIRLHGELRNDGPSAPGEPRVVYYDKEKCSAGFDCTLHLGDSPSSPKIIVVGKEQKRAGEVLVVRPPIN